jgi:O-methyltransferase
MARAVDAVRLLARALARHDQNAGYDFLELVGRRLAPAFKFPEWGRTYQQDEAFLDWYDPDRARSSFRSLDRRFTLAQLVQLARVVPGDSAECGVHEGRGSELICRGLAGLGKTHHAFDSWEGLSAPSGRDGPYWREGDLAADQAAAERRLAAWDVRFWKGWVPSRFAEVADRRFAFVHLDLDLYQPTADSIEFFHPRTMPGGVIVCDDYGLDACPGARDAFASFFASKPEPVVELSTGQAFVIVQATATATAT